MLSFERASLELRCCHLLIGDSVPERASKAWRQLILLTCLRHLQILLLLTRCARIERWNLIGAAAARPTHLITEHDSAGAEWIAVDRGV